MKNKFLKLLLFSITFVFYSFNSERKFKVRVPELPIKTYGSKIWGLPIFSWKTRTFYALKEMGADSKAIRSLDTKSLEKWEKVLNEYKNKKAEIKEKYDKFMKPSESILPILKDFMIPDLADISKSYLLFDNDFQYFIYENNPELIDEYKKLFGKPASTSSSSQPSSSSTSSSDVTKDKK